MAAAFDLHLLPFNRVKGQEWPQLPGLLAVAPPRRAARGREADQVIIYLTLSGNPPFTSSEYAQLVGQMAERFYQMPGSLTAAMRQTAEIVNQYLVERNLKTGGTGRYLTGRLIFAVLRGTQFVVAQSGPTDLFYLKAGAVRQYNDEQMAGRGLGYGQATPLYFSQIELKPGEEIILCAQLPAAWEEALLAERGPVGMEVLRRKLLSLTEEDLNAVLVQAQAGKGQMIVLQAMRPAVELPSPVPESAAEGVPTPPAQPVIPPAERPASRFARLLSGKGGGTAPQPAPEGEAAPTEATPVPGTDASPAQAPAPATPSRFVSPRRTADLPEIERPGQPRRLAPGRQEVFRGLARSLRGMRTFGERISQALKSFLPRLLPNLQDGTPHISPTVMIFIAVAVPVVLVVIASMVYVRYGQHSQYDEYYQQAVQSAIGAIDQNDPAVVRHAWESCLFYLDQADRYMQTQESQDLRNVAQAALDGLDGIIRLDFHQGVSALSDTVQVTRMVATETDLFMLNATRGNVMHALQSSQGYEVDPYFTCEAGVYDGIRVGPLIDMAALPAINLRNANVLAMDANGTLLYCTVGGEPTAVPLAPPELGWRGISGFALDTDGRNLYLLDPPGNAVWVYAGNLGEYAQLPIMFFGEQVPNGMNTAIDLAVNGDDVYLLFQDGHVTVCTLSRLDVVPTRCADPATFEDNRPGHQAGTQITDAVFNLMTFASAPDPSLYMLEPLTQAVYRFNPHTQALALQGQFRASMEFVRQSFTGPAVAMAISPNRTMFLCVGNKIFYATGVP